MTVATFEDNGNILTGGDWAFYDYFRGFGGSSSKRARLNHKDDWGTSGGNSAFTLSDTGVTFNAVSTLASNDNRDEYTYIYFAHA